MSWEDITMGQRAAPEHHRQRVRMSAYWQETCEMFERGWERFWKKLHKDEKGNWRRLDPPAVGKDLLDSEYVFDGTKVENLYDNNVKAATKARGNNA